VKEGHACPFLPATGELLKMGKAFLHRYRISRRPVVVASQVDGRNIYHLGLHIQPEVETGILIMRILLFNLG